MNFFEQLAEDSYIWQVIGIGEVVPHPTPDELYVRFYFQSIDHPTFGMPTGKVKSFKLPIRAIRKLKIGTKWQQGRNVTPRHNGGTWLDLNPSNIKLITAPWTVPANEILSDLKNTKYKSSRMLHYTNYLLHKIGTQKIIIPCSEVLRYYMAPSDSYLKLLMSDGIGELLRKTQTTNEILLLKNRKTYTSGEISATKLLSKSETSIKAAQFPYKSIKLTHTNNMLNKENNSLSIKAHIPSEDHIRIRASVWIPKPKDIFKLGKSTYIVNQIHSTGLYT